MKLSMQKKEKAQKLIAFDVDRNKEAPGWCVVFEMFSKGALTLETAVLIELSGQF